MSLSLSWLKSPYLVSSLVPDGTPPWLGCRAVKNNAPPEVCGGTVDNPPQDEILFDEIYDPILGYKPGVLKVTPTTCITKASYDSIYPRYTDFSVDNPFTRRPLRCFDRQMRISPQRWEEIKADVDRLRAQIEDLTDRNTKLYERLQKVAPRNTSYSSRGSPQFDPSYSPDSMENSDYDDDDASDSEDNFSNSFVSFRDYD